MLSEAERRTLSNWARRRRTAQGLALRARIVLACADGGPNIQFNLFFPRARTYRIWVQFQRKGVVNTASFTVPVSELK